MVKLFKYLLITSCIALLYSCNNAENKEKTVTVLLETDQGDITLALYPERAPVTVANFIRNVEDGLYDGGRFYRASRPDNNLKAKRKVLTIIQGGKNEEKPAREPIAHETTDKTGISHQDGVISMARLDPGTATTEFFISIGDNSGLDIGSDRYDVGQRQGYATFGRVTRGMDVVVRIQQLPTGEKAKDEEDWFGQQVINDPVTIKRALITKTD